MATLGVPFVVSLARSLPELHRGLRESVDGTNLEALTEPGFLYTLAPFFTCLALADMMLKSGTGFARRLGQYAVLTLAAYPALEEYIASGSYVRTGLKLVPQVVSGIGAYLILRRGNR